MIDTLRLQKMVYNKNSMSEMEEQKINTAETSGSGTAEGQSEVKTAQKTEQSSGSKLPLIIAAIILVLAGLVYLFIKLDPEITGRIRDISLIVYALAGIVSIAALVVLVVQAARFVNFMKYEILPILNTTDKTVRKLSGTVSFLCESAVEPTIKTASTLSGIKDTASSILSVFKK